MYKNYLIYTGHLGKLHPIIGAKLSDFSKTYPYSSDIGVPPDQSTLSDKLSVSSRKEVENRHGYIARRFVQAITWMYYNEVRNENTWSVCIPM